MASSHAVQGFFVMILRMSLGVISGSTSIQAKSVMHLAITPEEGWPIRLWSQNTSCMIFAVDGVLLFSCFLFRSLSLNALNTAWLCVGFLVGVCFSLTPGGGRDSDTLVAGHSAAVRCWAASWDNCGTRMLELTMALRSM